MTYCESKCGWSEPQWDTKGSTCLECAENAMAELMRLRQKIEALAGLVKAAESLLGVIGAHELESLSCDGDGEKWCECLESEVSKTNNALAALGKGE